MKTPLAYFIPLLPIVFLSLSGHAQSIPSFPFYIAATQNYSFQGTTYSDVAGEIEQVIGENGPNYILLSPKGVKLEIPKSITRNVNLDEAADGLAKGRAHAYEMFDTGREHYFKLLNDAKQLDALCIKLKQEQAQAMQILTAIAQQQRNSGTTAVSQQSDMLKLMQQMEDLSKSPYRRIIPNENRYEVEVKQR